MDHFENLTADRPTFVTHLECSATGEHYEADQLHGLSDAGKPLLVRYDLDAISAVIAKETLAARPPDMRRYRLAVDWSRPDKGLTTSYQDHRTQTARNLPS